MDFETGPSDPSFYHYLDAVKRAMNAGIQMALIKKLLSSIDFLKD